MRTRLTQKQETFCVEYFSTGNATQSAITAGYSPRYVATNTTKLLNNTNIYNRIKQLQEAAVSSAIMSVTERKERLTKLANEDIYSAKGTLLRSANIQSIDILNKMDKIYSDGSTVNVDNRKIEIIVSSERGKELTQRLLEGGDNGDHDFPQTT